MTRSRRALFLAAAGVLALAGGYLFTQAGPPPCVGVSACGSALEVTR